MFEGKLRFGYGWLEREGHGTPEDVVQVGGGEWLRVSDGQPTQARTIAKGLRPGESG